MTRRPDIVYAANSTTEDTQFECPHCGVLQATSVYRTDFNAMIYVARQCRNCRDLDLRISYRSGSRSTPYMAEAVRFFPAKAQRRTKDFRAVPPEVEKAYGDACGLRSVHVGAAGAYARRALELLLDSAGYASNSLDASIKLARAETELDKRLPKRLLQKLDYIREIGNFALHVRRDNELVIVAIGEEEVDACLETVEGLIGYIYEEPLVEYERVMALNEKLRAANKREIPLPDLPLLPMSDESAPPPEGGGIGPGDVDMVVDQG